METQKRIDEKEAEMLGILAGRAGMRDKIDRCVVLGLSFADEYPEDHAWLVEAEAKEREAAALIGELEGLRERELAAPDFDGCAGQRHEAGFAVMSGGTLYEVVQAHTFADGWRPEDTPSLFKVVRIPSEDGKPAEWVQPAGAHDAYAKGEEVSHNGKVWVSTVDGNVWEPGVYGWTEKV